MPSILAIINNNPAREAIADILKLAGYDVLEAVNGKQGVITATNMNPDLILCDLGANIMDGYVVLKIIRDYKGLKYIPFIFVTENSNWKDIRMAMSLGADDFITGPFSPSELLSAVEYRLRKALSRNLYREADIVPDVLVPEKVISTFSMSSFISNRDNRYYKSKQKIYEKGEHPLALYFIIKGTVKTYKTGESGKEYITGLPGEGDFFGHIAMLNGADYHDSAEALDDVILAIIPAFDFEKMMEVSSFARKYFIQLLVRNLEKELQLLRIAFDSLRKRIAHVLLELNKVSRDGGIKYSRSNLAALVGVTKESFVRTLSELREEGFIEIRSGTIFIIDSKGLLKLKTDSRER